MESINSRRIILGFILVVAGSLLLLDNFNFFDYLPFELRRVIFNWPMFFMVIGVIALVSSRKKIIGVIFFSIGAYLWSSRFLDIDLNWVRDFWPLAIILIGVYILVKHSGRTKMFENEKKSLNTDEFKSGSASSDYLDEIAIFGGGDKSVSSIAFKGGKATCIFGGSDISFANAKLENDKPAVIEVLCLFGGLSLKVPKDWTVHSEVTPILGGFGDDRNPADIFPDPRKVLIIRGLVIFGGGDIKSA